MNFILKVPFFRPWVSEDDKKAVTKALDSRWLTNGPNLKNFEKGINNFIGTKFSLGVGSATHALHLAVKSLGIGNGDEVIVPTFTFAATANAAIYCGAKPVFVDVQPDTFNISPDCIEKKISKRTKAIIVVHYGGQACDMDEILKISSKYSIKIIEDCAHALGSTYRNNKCGNIGQIGCFSFYPTKVITTGEGGMLTTNNKKLYQQALLFRSQAMSVSAVEREKQSTWKYDIVDLGFNYRMDEMRASLGSSQLKRINKINKKRIDIAKKYDELIEKINGLTIPSIKHHRNHIYHLYTIKIEKKYPISRDKLFNKLSKKGIGTSVQYFPLHLMSYYKKNYKIKNNDFQIANSLKDKVLSLPIFPGMTDQEINYVVSQLR